MHQDKTQLTLFPEAPQPSKPTALPPHIGSHRVKAVSVCRVLVSHSMYVWRCYELCPLTAATKLIRQGSSMRGYKKYRGNAWRGYDTKMRTLAEFELKLYRRHGARYLTLFQKEVRGKRQQLLPHGWRVSKVYVQPMLQYTFELHEPDAWVTYLYDEEAGRLKKQGGGISTLSSAQRKKVKYAVLGKCKAHIRKRDKQIEDENRRAHSLFSEPF